MAAPSDSDPAPPLRQPDLPGSDNPAASRPQLPDVHGLTPPKAPASIGVEFTQEADLSAAVAMPPPPPPPEPAPAVPEPPVESAAPGQTDQPSGPSRRMATGRMFGGYELMSKLGQGGMGEVYKARQVSLDRVVAIKILSKQLYDNDEFIKRFEREAKGIARITHPNIVGVYDFGKIDGLRFMVNEFVDGASLAKLISDRLLLPPNEVVSLMVQCLAGLHHVGSQGIVHRDIKPDNILITKDNIAKIADFGLAKDVSRKDDHTDLTAVGLAMGTPAYMSPEQCMGQKLDVRSDIYAFGVTAWFALTGQKPFVGNSSFEVMTKQREFIPPSPHEVVPGIPPALSAVVMRMLAKRVEERYPDAESCRQAWIEVGVQLGVFGLGDLQAIARSSPAPAAPGGEAAPLVSLPPPVPLPPAPGSEPPPSLPPPPVPGAAAPTAEPPPSGRVGPASTRLGPTTETVRGGPATDRPVATSDRPSRRLADSATCPMCGNLNRPDASVCSRCGHVLKEGSDAATLQQQEAEAQRLFEARRFGEAAALWARLADREQDKRARSVLRSKEREARKQEHDARVNDLRARANAAVSRGDLKNALELLEQGREVHRSSAAATTSSSVSDVQLEHDIVALRQRLATRRRLWQIAVVLLAIIVLVIAVLAFLGRARTPVVPPEAPGQPLPVPLEGAPPEPVPPAMPPAEAPP